MSHDDHDPHALDRRSFVKASLISAALPIAGAMASRQRGSR